MRRKKFSDIDTFRFGKYAGQKIKEVHDVEYTCWYFGVLEDEEHKNFVKEFLYNNFCEFRTSYRGIEYVVSPSRLKKEQLIEDEKEVILDKASDGSDIYLQLTSNPNCLGQVKVKGITYTFPKVKEYNSYGFHYHLPVQNGKAIRVKNKTLKVKLMEFDSEIFISKFTIVK